MTKHIVKKSSLALLIRGLCAVPLLLQVCSAQAAQVSALGDNPAPTKTITIYNDSPETIYPVIGTGAMTGGDQWLRAYFQDQQNNYAQSNIYRIYVNVQNGQVQGIPPNGYASVQIPFYNPLESSPQPSAPNQYIDWWNAGQIYVYDQQANVQAAYQADVNGAAPVQLYGTAPVITVCDANSSCQPINQNIYPAAVDSSNNPIGLPVNDPDQLAEYTFGQLNGNTVDTTIVDYDLSYVNELYLPMAIEPAGDSSVGYTGTTMSVGNFRNTLINWLQNDPNGQNWPVFFNSNGGLGPNNPKVPSTNYVWGYSNELAPASKINTMQNQLDNLWNYCINPTGYPLPANTPVPPSAECQDINTIYPLFEQSYEGAYGAQPSPPSENNLLQDVYGFNAVTNNSVTGPFPVDTITADKPADDRLEDSYQTYASLASADIFDPYVELIHGTSANDLNIPYVYAFPYDDAAGNTQVEGTGLIITVGGGTQLPNPNPNIPSPPNSSTVSVMLGAPGANGPSWNQYGVCTSTPDQAFSNGDTGENILIPLTATYPCTISITDSNNQLYQFTLTQAPPFTKADITDCSGAGTWCSGVTSVAQGQGIAAPGPGN